MATKDGLGGFGEDLVAAYLSSRGLTVVDRNWRCELGEIDLVARDGTTLVVCEVKTRSALGYGAPVEAVTYRKATRLRRLAARWLAAHGTHARDIRIDVVGVLVRPGSEPVIDHVRAAA